MGGFEFRQLVWLLLPASRKRLCTPRPNDSERSSSGFEDHLDKVRGERLAPLHARATVRLERDGLLTKAPDI